MYTQSITRTHRTAFVLALDCSGSMVEPVSFNGQRISKAEAVALVTNRLLFELTERARRSDGVRNYYDVAVVGYSGTGVRSLLNNHDSFCSIEHIAQAGKESTHSTRAEYTLPDGSRAILDEIPLPMWVKPTAEGETPMYEAMLWVRDLLRGWVFEPKNAESFPPVVFNITDGEASDCSEEELREVTEQIRTLRTADGNVLLINIHIASATSERSLIFPALGELLHGNRYASLLYDCSSTMPESFNPAIREIRGGQPPYRGMSYNASVTELISVLNIGSISVKTE